MTSNSVIHQDQPKQLSAVFRRLRRWLRLKSTVLTATLINNMCLVFASVIKTLMVTFTCFFLPL